MLPCVPCFSSGFKCVSIVAVFYNDSKIIYSSAQAIMLISISVAFCKIMVCIGGLGMY